MKIISSPLPAGMRNVRDYGAAGDGAANDTAAIQRALDAGGIVYLPAGIYRCGTLHLRSNGGLQLDENARILASHAAADYNADDYCPQNSDCPEERVSGRHLISAVEAENVSIEGGIIDGDAAFWMEGVNPKHPMICIPNPERPAQMVYFAECRNVRLTNTLLTNASYWHCHLHGCEHAEITGLKIQADPSVINADGLDIDCCTEVTVRDCDINAGDDALTLRGDDRKLRRPRACERISVENCRLASAYACAVRFGVGDGEIRNCTLSRLTITRAKAGFSFVAKWSDEPGDEGVCIRDILISEVEMSVLRPFIINLDHKYLPEIHHPSRSIFERISFRDIRGQGELTSFILGNRTGKVRDFLFADVTLEIAGKGEAPFMDERGMWCVDSTDAIFEIRDAENIRFEKVLIRPRPCWQWEVRAKNAQLQGIPADWRVDKTGETVPADC